MGELQLIQQSATENPTNSTVAQALQGAVGTTTAVQNQDLITVIFAQPWIWLVIIVGIVGLVIVKVKGKPKRPELTPFYGVQVRKKMTEETIKKRVETWGHKGKFTLYKGFLKVGKTIKIEPITRVNQNKEEGDYLNIGFRNFGMWPWIKAVLLHRYEHILVDPKVCRVDPKVKAILINPKAFVFEDSGVWTIATNKETEFIDELNIRKDVENIKGFTSDFLRRLSNEAPSQAIETERMVTSADLEERQRKSRISSWVGGK